MCTMSPKWTIQVQSKVLTALWARTCFLLRFFFHVKYISPPVYSVPDTKYIGRFILEGIPQIPVSCPYMNIRTIGHERCNICQNVLQNSNEMQAELIFYEEHELEKIFATTTFIFIIHSILYYYLIDIATINILSS